MSMISTTFMGRRVVGKEPEVWMSNVSGDNISIALGTSTPARLSQVFDWGNETLGAQQLAMTILTIVAGPLIAERRYEDFTRRFIAPITSKGWHIEGEDIHKFLNPHLAKLDSDDFEIQEERLNECRVAAGFTARWSLFDHTDVSEEIDFKIVKLTYNGFAVEFPEEREEPFCWFDLWRAADFLYTISDENGDHRFIEGFDEIEDGVFELMMGS